MAVWYLCVFDFAKKNVILFCNHWARKARLFFFFEADIYLSQSVYNIGDLSFCYANKKARNGGYIKSEGYVRQWKVKSGRIISSILEKQLFFATFYKVEKEINIKKSLLSLINFL